jgi:nicotinic acid mononucleotide adenylyltransferase
MDATAPTAGHADGRIAVFPGSFDPLTVAHLAVARAVVDQRGVSHVHLALSTTTLGKAHLDDSTLDRRVAALRRRTREHDWLEVVVVEHSLVADIAQGYDVVVMGADKWAQVNDAAWYGDDVTARDDALARLPEVAVAPRMGHHVPDGLSLELPAELAHVSATAVRQGRTDWAAP